MPVDLFALYRTPADPAAFDAHYGRVHVPLTVAMPGLLQFDYSRGRVDANEGDYYLVARLRWATDEDRLASLASREGRAAVADLANFAQAGVVLVTAPVEPAL
jgi:uncharacterized protein (TIGR02118 family)